jgi:hypothetical protein
MGRLLLEQRQARETAREARREVIVHLPGS